MVRGSRFSVRGAWCAVRGAWCAVLGSGGAVVLAFVMLPAIAAAQDPHAGHTPPSPQKPAAPEKPANPETPAKPAEEDHSAHAGHGSEQPKEPLPVITDADRAAAFPSGLDGHATHDRRVNVFVLLDQFEWQGGENGGVSIDNKNWIGGDVHRLWLRGEGESSAGRPENAQIHAMYGRSVARWWDLVVGMRQDFRPGDPQAWLAVGVQGLAPQWFEVEVTGYLGQSGRTHLRLEVEYELLFTNRLILQPLIEAEIYGKDDPERGIGAGLSAFDAGLRLRYEIRREFAPYVGITWHRAMFGTADYARADGVDVGRARLVVGARTWF
jgi:copper resistance protein B